jgi:hypothetical protein
MQRPPPTGLAKHLASPKAVSRRKRTQACGLVRWATAAMPARSRSAAAHLSTQTEAQTVLGCMVAAFASLTRLPSIPIALVRLSNEQALSF